MRLTKLFVVILLVLEVEGIAQAETQAEREARQESEAKAFVDAVDRGAYDFLLPPPSPRYGYDITEHSNCVLDNSKTSQTPIQANRISMACRVKATPRKCRDVSAMPPDNNSKSPQEICVEACGTASIWSRKFGECSLD